MDFIKTNPLTDKGITKWTNDAAEQMNRGKTVQSQDFHITKTPHGTKISLKARHKFIYEDPYKGEWDPDAEYHVGDVVRVMPLTIYSDASQNDALATPGVWKCVAHVPSTDFSNFVKSNAGLFSAYEFVLYARANDVNYWPVWPELDDVSIISDNPAALKGRFWDMIGQLPREMNVCTGDGQEATYFVGAFPSGSASN